MRLYNVVGERLDLSEEAWRFLRERARGSGWQPNGTRTPARTVTTALSAEGAVWGGSYEDPHGQEVTRADAGRLGSALQFSLQMGAWTEDLMQLGLALSRFCGRGGFLICSEAEVPRNQILFRSLFELREEAIYQESLWSMADRLAGFGTGSVPKVANPPVFQEAQKEQPKAAT